MSKTDEAAERIETYIRNRSNRRGLTDEIHAVDVGCDTEGVLTLADLRTVMEERSHARNVSEHGTDEERFAEWWASTPTWTPGEMAIIERGDQNLGPMTVAFLAGLESERSRTRELVAKIKALPFIGGELLAVLEEFDV